MTKNQPTNAELEAAARQSLARILQSPASYDGHTVAAALRIALGDQLRPAEPDPEPAIDYTIRQTHAGSIDAFVWRYGERTANIWHAPGRVTKYRHEPARIDCGTISGASPADVETTIELLAACRDIARQLDSEFAQGVPDVTQYQQEEAQP